MRYFLNPVLRNRIEPAALADDVFRLRIWIFQYPATAPVPPF